MRTVAELAEQKHFGNGRTDMRKPFPLIHLHRLAMKQSRYDQQFLSHLATASCQEFTEYVTPR